MVCKWGMSELIGPMAVGEQSQEVFIGREWVANRDHSEETARLVDGEVKRIIDTAMTTADKLLREHIDSLHRVAAALLDRETLTGDEVKRLMDGETLPPLDLRTHQRVLKTTDDYDEEEKTAKKEGKSRSDRPRGPDDDDDDRGAFRAANSGSDRGNRPATPRSPLGSALDPRRQNDDDRDDDSGSKA
jgi:cell division protease FtsH